MTHPQLLRRLRAVRFAILWMNILCLCLGLASAGLYFQQNSRRRSQMQTDSKVATVWVMGVTHGPEHTLTRGTPLQKWLNRVGIRALGDYRVLTGKYGGDPNSVQIWFDYASQIPTSKELECHRVGPTAFMDDLGQFYHGYLDFHDKYVGVYLPGYDHAARRLLCLVRWMPRRPDTTEPSSRPMAFTVDLPGSRRVLPPAARLSASLAAQTNEGVTVTASDGGLSGIRTDAYSTSQRRLSFRLRIQGGRLADMNVDAGYSAALSAASARGGFRRPGSGFMPSPAPAGLSTPPANSAPLFSIVDPYGVSLVPNGEMLFPMLTADDRPVRDRTGAVWVAPVNSAGKGTDVVRLKLHVIPDSGSTPIPFELTIPVQTSDEI